MVGTVVVIRPSATPPSRISHLYAGELIEWLSENGFNVIDIQKGMVTQPMLYATLMQLRTESDAPPLICYYGHGEKDRLVGDMTYSEIPLIGRNLNLVVDGFNQDWFKDCIVYTFACDSGRELGPNVVKNGALSYFGNLNSTYIGYPEIENDYFRDFGVMANTIPKALVDGFTVTEAMVLFQRSCDYYTTIYQHQKDWFNSDFYRFAVNKNRTGYRLFKKKDDVRWMGV